MTSYVDASGFHRPTLQEIRKQVEAQFVVAIGSGVDLTATGPFGQIVANITTWADSLFAIVQEAYTQQDPDQATGVFLDEACNKVGIYRLPATPAYVDDVLLWGTFGSAVTVPAGSKAKSATQPMSYSLQSDVSLGASSTGPFRAVRLSGTFTTGNVLSTTLNGVAYTYTVLITDTTSTAIQELADNINAGAFASVGAASLEVISGTNYLRIDGDSFTLDAYSSHWTPYQEVLAGVFVADNPQVQAVPPLTLDTILTPVSGWISIEQPSAGLDGTDVETDASLRIRRIQGTRSGTATEDAIREAIYRVPGVSKAIVDSNRSDDPDAEGRDGHMLEAVVIGGNASEVAAAIWSTIGAGIAMYGATEVSVPGADGKTHPVKFSIPNPQYAWVKVTSIVPDTDAGPAAGYQAAIQAAVVEFGNQQFGLGANFNYQRMFSPVLSVPGIGSATIAIAVTATESGSPSYVSANIPVASRDYLTFAADRVVFV